MKAVELKWWQALNPPIYLISILPALAILSVSSNQSIWTGGLLSATLAVVLLQHAINLFNDVSDWRLGADSEKMDSWVRLHAGQTRPVFLHAVSSFLLGGLLGLAVLLYADRLWILLVAAPLIGLGYLYNAGERPLSYTWMGEWVTGICYGGVFGCLWLVAGNALDTTAMLGMLAFAALATALLLSHQPRQIETDRTAGKHSFAVRYGKQTTCRVSLGLFLLFAVLFAQMSWSVFPGLLWQVLFVVLIFLLLAYVSTEGPNPKRILLSASGMILFVLLRMRFM
ncbi:MAG: prenyltransferase [Chromatiales bacterium]